MVTSLWAITIIALCQSSSLPVPLPLSGICCHHPQLLKELISWWFLSCSIHHLLLPPKCVLLLGSSCFPLLHFCYNILYIYTHAHAHKYWGKQVMGNQIYTKWRWEGINESRMVGQVSLSISLCLCSEISFRGVSVFPVTLNPIRPFCCFSQLKNMPLLLEEVFEIPFKRVKWT